MRNLFFLVVFGALLFTSDLASAEPFLLKGRGNATAVVNETKLTLALDLGDDDYSSPKKFDMSIGGCVINIATDPKTPSGIIIFHFKHNGKIVIADNPTQFIVTDSEFYAIGTQSTSNRLKGDFNFEKINDTYSKIDVKLDGAVPPSFNLSSSSAELYVSPTAATTPVLASATEEPKLDTKTIVLISVGSILFVVFLIGLGIAIFFIVRCCRKRKEKKNEKADANVETAIAVASDSGTEPKVVAKSTKVEETEKPKKDADKSKSSPTKKLKKAKQPKKDKTKEDKQAKTREDKQPKKAKETEHSIAINNVEPVSERVDPNDIEVQFVQSQLRLIEKEQARKAEANDESRR